MCRDFPCGIVNVNRISWGINTFPQAAAKTQACGYFCSLGSSQLRDTEDPTGGTVAHIFISSQSLEDQLEKLLIQTKHEQFDSILQKERCAEEIKT